MKTAHFLSLDAITSQNLASAALSYTTSFARKRKIEQVLIHFSAAVTETVTITFDSAHGSNYDTVLKVQALTSATDFVWRPEGELNLQSADALKVQCTNNGTTGVCYVTIKNSEM